MPAELQQLGNNYTRDEFKRHKTCNETEAKIFMVEWTNYAVQLSKQLGLGVRGRPKGYIGEHLKNTDLDKFADDQIVQLYELMKAATHDSTDDNGTDSTSNESEKNFNNGKHRNS